MNKLEIFKKITARSLIAVLIVDEIEEAVDAANALLKGGVSVIELALRTSVAFEAIRAVIDNCPDMLVGAGTVLQPGQVENAVKAGAHFALSPGINKDVIREAADIKLPFVPGISTPSELQQAIDLDCRQVKLFPAEPLGGLPYLMGLASPYKHLQVKYIPLGGVNISNMGDYLSYPDVMAVGGSWLTPKGVIKEGAWEKVTDMAKISIKMIGMQVN